MFEDEETEEENYEVEAQDDNSDFYCFGTELNRTYSGLLMEKLDQIYRDDLKRGHILMKPGMILNHRYEIVSLIGRGTFALVWFAFDHLKLQNVAIKILRHIEEDPDETEKIAEEIVLNEYLSTCEPQLKQCDYITHFLESFYYQEHCCLVFELVSQNILTFLNYFDDQFVKIPLKLIKKIACDTLKGLMFMHEHGVIHTDLKPENVFAERPIFPYSVFNEMDQRSVFNCFEDDPSTINFKLGDFGNSCFIDDNRTILIQTRQYRAPEVLLGMTFDASADIWSFGCMVYELLTGYFLFAPNITEDGEIEETKENMTEIDSMHLSMIEGIIGPIPQKWAKKGKLYNALYVKEGVLRWVSKQDLMPIAQLMMSKGIEEKEAKEATNFLIPMLAIIPSQRPTARELLDSPWLYDV